MGVLEELPQPPILTDGPERAGKCVSLGLLNGPFGGASATPTIDDRAGNAIENAFERKERPVGIVPTVRNRFQ
jgi:hypothetical protein